MCRVCNLISAGFLALSLLFSVTPSQAEGVAPNCPINQQVSVAVADLKEKAPVFVELTGEKALYFMQAVEEQVGPAPFEVDQVILAVVLGQEENAVIGLAKDGCFVHVQAIPTGYAMELMKRGEDMKRQKEEKGKI